MDNTIDLVHLMSGVAAKLPQIDDDNELTFLPEMFPAIPEIVETDQLVITRGYHNYGSWRIDYPQVSGSKPVYEALGIATAAVLLQPELGALTIRLTNSNSEIRELRIAYRHSARSPFGLHQVPVLFDYFPDQVVRHPWLHGSVQHPDQYPQFVLTNADDFLANEDEWKNRDVLVGFGSAQGTARMIQLFLDMSRQSNDCTEVALEAEPGFRGVAPASAEIRFWLPGGDFFIETNFP